MEAQLKSASVHRLSLNEQVGSQMIEDPFSTRAAKSIDRSGVYRAYESWPVYAAENIKRRVKVEGDFDRVVFLAIGGSAAAGDLLSDWLLASGRKEFSVFKGVMPNAMLDRSLVIVCSASGNTQETVALAERAAKSRATIVTISSGGRLKQFSEKMQLRHLDIEVAIAPRYTLPSMLFATLAILRGAGMLDGLERELDDAVSSMKITGTKIATSVPSPRNPAKKLARSLAGSIPKIYGSSLTRGVAIRFKNSLNENAKMHACADCSPELFHNEVESWERGSGGFVPVLVRHKQEPARERDQLEALLEVLKKKTEPVEVWGESRTRLGQIVSLCYQIDFASYYAAILSRVDPAPIRMIERLKAARPG